MNAVRTRSRNEAVRASREGPSPASVLGHETLTAEGHRSTLVSKASMSDAEFRWVVDGSRTVCGCWSDRTEDGETGWIVPIWRTTDQRDMYLALEDGRGGREHEK